MSHAALRSPVRLVRLEAQLARIEHVRTTESSARVGYLLLHFDAARTDIARMEAAVDAATDAELRTPLAPAVPRKRPLKLQSNRYAKVGMLATLGSSLALAATGTKRWHTALG